MPEKCDICGEYFKTLWDLERDFRFSMPPGMWETDAWMNKLKKDRMNERETNCHCHNCLVKECQERIASDKTYCSKHTVNSLTPRQCKGDGGDEKSIYWCSCKNKVITADGYCQYHENQCAECPRRLASWDKYCFKHWNGYCKVINCSERTPNYHNSNHYIYCEQHAKLYGNSLSNYQNIQQEKTQQRQQKETEQTKLKSLVKANTTIAGEIKEVERFSTDWNKNLATVIAENSNYWVFLLVLAENREVRVFPVKADYQGSYGIYERKRARHYSLAEAQSEASWLRGMLNGENLILVLHPSANDYVGFNSLVREPYVEWNYGVSTSKFKPLDIVWVSKKAGFNLGEGNLVGQAYDHVGVYLGNNQVCHLSGDGEGVKITNWSEFLKGQNGRICRYSPIIPFKNYKTIAENIAWADTNAYRQGRYCLSNRKDMMKAVA